MSFQETNLWKSSLGLREDDTYSETRELLRSQLLSMRQKVAHLVSQIPVDCRTLTVHDVSHLDALWESAQQVAGDKWQMNPAEAFVFGAAVLVHDAGLTTLAYPDGLTGLKETLLWKDIAATQQISNNSPHGKLKELSSDDEARVTFEVLRALHAAQANELCTQSWKLSKDNYIYLLDDSELREAYGESIGRIAASHHWAPEKILANLSSQIGGSPKLPAQWTVNERKLGCLLRCADAAQVDRTRAPIALYAALSPKGISDSHWKAQSKLNRAALRDDAIFFTSSSSFNDQETDAWWVAFDLAALLDKELRSSNALLTDIGEPSFTAQRVAGSESPESFAKYVRTSKWRPIDATVRVTDPLRLARTLGGRNLYGNSFSVPFRELLQNASDAIRARRALQQRDRDFGSIRVIIEHHPSDATKCIVHIDDNGIGMSERVLTTTLVDFGKSLWTSAILKEEFPGLKSSNFQSIGKFGIGFFSVFEISSHVSVVSRRFDAAASDARALVFKGLVVRPLLREADSSELPIDFVTRVSLCLNEDLANGKQSSEISSTSDFDYEMIRQNRGHARSQKISDIVMGFCSFLDIKVEFLDRRNNENHTHLPDIYEKPGRDLLSDLANFDPDVPKASHFSPATSLSPLLSDGNFYGRAALDVDAILEKRRLGRSFVSVGGIVSPGRTPLNLGGIDIPFVGVVECETERAARDYFQSLAPSDAILNWIREQIFNLDKELLRKSELMTLASFAYSVTGLDCGLPFAFCNQNCLTVTQVSALSLDQSEFRFPISWRYDAWCETIGYDNLSPDYFEAKSGDTVVVLPKGSGRLIEEEQARAARKFGIIEVDRLQVMKNWEAACPFIQLVENNWNYAAKFTVDTKSIFSTRIASLAGTRWVLSMSRS